MIVSKSEHERMTRFPDGSPKVWNSKVDRSERGEVIAVYARRRGRGVEPRYVYAHRELTGALNSRNVIDHLNGIGLDNRGTREFPVNLRVTSRSHNAHNARRVRKKNQSLLRGVEKRGNRFGGIMAKRLGPKETLVVRSKRTWSTQEPAHRWYMNRLERKTRGRVEWASNPQSVNWPKLPPRLESEPVELRRPASVLEEVPF